MKGADRKKMASYSGNPLCEFFASTCTFQAQKLAKACA